MSGRLLRGLMLEELGASCEGMDYRSVGAALTRMRKRMSKDAELKARYERIRGRLETEA